MMLRLLRNLVVPILLCCAPVAPVRGAAPDVLVLAQTGDTVHQEAIAAFRATLQRLAPGRNIETRAADAHASGVEADAQDARILLIVTFGRDAATAISRQGVSTPAIHALLSRGAYDVLPHSPTRGPHTAIVLDQPAARQIALIRLALPQFSRVATLHGPDPHAAAAAAGITAAARAADLDAHAIRIDDEQDLYAGLRSALDAPAVLVSQPDAQVFNRYTVQNILMTAYRMRSPVLGHSAAFVRAGAAIGLYTTPTQAGEEAAALAARVLSGSHLPPPSAPGLFEVDVNPTVARALGLAIPAPDGLRAALREAEGGGR